MLTLGFFAWRVVQSSSSDDLYADIGTWRFRGIVVGGVRFTGLCTIDCLAGLGTGGLDDGASIQTGRGEYSEFIVAAGRGSTLGSATQNELKEMLGTKMRQTVSLTLRRIYAALR